MGTPSVNYCFRPSRLGNVEASFTLRSLLRPLSFMNENTVFMLITAMLKNFFLYLTQTLSGSVKAIRKTSRLKKVLLHFICLPGKLMHAKHKCP